MSELDALFEQWRKQYPCPPSQRLTQDQRRCALCGVVWDIDEARPDCDNRPKGVAEP